ncbi:MAG: class I SAM-dependent methyltransferase [Caldilineaceae bacterium]|nr:class I SAM-dependent methyltransferase [Caldilineaceae bacterium]MCB9139888.1 class I SAM-dependent methyltransferase [Caldilineaceae bacterium]
MMTTYVNDEYTLLDSGNTEKLEQVGPYRLVRPAPQAIWPSRSPQSDWEQVDAVYVRDNSGGGKWQWRNKVKRDFDILYNHLSFRIKMTNFGHLGLFPEQAENWDWLREQIRARMARTNGANLHVLNLFAYTGGSTLAASQGGAHVVHVDAAKGVVDWARKNAEKSGLADRPIRWLVDDALKFVKREVRRGNRYHGIIFDPPSFGRGPKGEVFKIENDIVPLLDACRQLLAKDALFLLYSCHTPGFTPLTLENQLGELVHSRAGSFDSGEMVVRDAHGRPLPSGAYARWLAKEEQAKAD